MSRRGSILPLVGLLLTACTSMEPLHRGDPDVALDLVARAGASEDWVVGPSPERSPPRIGSSRDSPPPSWCSTRCRIRSCG